MPNSTIESRQTALSQYNILDTIAEESFDDLVKVASQVCGMPVSLITFLDDQRQWFKAKVGTDLSETPIAASLCVHAMNSQDVTVIPDLTIDDRTAHNPIVAGPPYVKFYAGAPLRTPDNIFLGTLCVIDFKPNSLTEEQVFALKTLSHQVMTQLELRRALKEKNERESRNEAILESAIDYGIISTDLKGIVTSWNVGAETILGWKAEEMIGRPAHTIFTAQDIEAKVPESEMQKATDTGKGSDERWHLRKDGSRFWALGMMMPLKSEDDKQIGFLKILRDRSEQHEAAVRLAASESKYQELFNALENGFCIIEIKMDSDGNPIDYRHLETNPAFERLTGLVNCEGKWIRDIVPEHEQYWVDLYASVLKTGRTVSVENEAKALNRWYEVHAFRTGLPDSYRVAVLFNDISERKKAEELQKTLTQELQHRIKNTLAMVKAISNQTLRGGGAIEDIRDAFGERLQALSRAHDILTRSSWTNAPITQVVAGSLKAHQLEDQNRITVHGPEVNLLPKQGLSLALTIHELATNAAKYGALSTPEGQVQVNWSLDDKGFDFTWREKGGPKVEQPGRVGFGTRLIKRSLADEFQGEVSLEYTEQGIVCHLHAPSASLQA